MRKLQLISQKLKRVNQLYLKILSKELAAFNMEHYFEATLLLADQ